MSKVIVYRFKRYDIRSDYSQESRRWATREAIARVGGVALEDTATEIDADFVGAEEPGMTEMGFDPQSFAGFQTKVRS